MCFRDWGIGRLVRTTVHNLADPSAGPFDIPANAQRIALYASATDSSGLTNPYPFLTLPDNQTPLVVGCIGSQFLYMNLLCHGDLPTSNMHINFVGATGFTLGSWIEWTVPESYLALPLEELFRNYPGMR
jgi:hypothetical protein